MSKYKIVPQKSTGLITSKELTKTEIKEAFAIFKRFGYKKNQFKVIEVKSLEQVKLSDLYDADGKLTFEEWIEQLKASNP